MNIYLDTSALVKLYIDEDGSDIVNDSTDRATIVSTSRIAYAEALSAFVQCKDEKVLSKKIMINALLVLNLIGKCIL